MIQYQLQSEPETIQTEAVFFSSAAFWKIWSRKRTDSIHFEFTAISLSSRATSLLLSGILAETNKFHWSDRILCQYPRHSPVRKGSELHQMWSSYFLGSMFNSDECEDSEKNQIHFYIA